MVLVVETTSKLSKTDFSPEKKAEVAEIQALSEAEPEMLGLRSEGPGWPFKGLSKAYLLCPCKMRPATLGSILGPLILETLIYH